MTPWSEKGIGSYVFTSSVSVQNLRLCWNLKMCYFCTRNNFLNLWRVQQNCMYEGWSLMLYKDQRGRIYDIVIQWWARFCKNDTWRTGNQLNISLILVIPAEYGYSQIPWFKEITINWTLTSLFCLPWYRKIHGNKRKMKYIKLWKWN